MNNFTGTSAPFNAATNMTGSKTLTGSTVADGNLYANCNAYSGTLADSQWVASSTTSTPLSAGWWAWSVSVKVSAGSPEFWLHDLSTSQIGSFTPPIDGLGHTYGGIGLVASGTPTVGLYARGSTGSAVTETFRIREFQLIKFDTREKAENFLASRAYAA
jgi:hypothetical protein